MKSMNEETKWYKDGIRFECQGSGKCCTSHGEFGFVYVDRKDRQRLAKHLNISTSAFTKTYCEKRQGVWHLIERKDNPDCLFLEGKSCGVYQGRPSQCRTWPFWPEVMDAKAWKKDVVSFCPGVGKGRLIPAEEIERNLAEQKLTEKRLTRGD